MSIAKRGTSLCRKNNNYYYGSANFPALWPILRQCDIVYGTRSWYCSLLDLTVHTTIHWVWEQLKDRKDRQYRSMSVITSSSARANPLPPPLMYNRYLFASTRSPHQHSRRTDCGILAEQSWDGRLVQRFHSKSWLLR